LGKCGECSWEAKISVDKHPNSSPRTADTLLPIQRIKTRFGAKREANIGCERRQSILILSLAGSKSLLVYFLLATYSIFAFLLSSNYGKYSQRPSICWLHRRSRPATSEEEWARCTSVDFDSFILPSSFFTLIPSPTNNPLLVGGSDSSVED